METLSVAVLLLSFALVNGVAQLNTCHSSVCLSQTVQYQCTVDGQGTFSLRWRIRNSAGSQIDTESYTVGDQLGTDVLATDFTTNFTSNTNPLISNISFTAQSHLNNSVIQCELTGGTPVNCTIVIEGPPTVVPNSMSFTANSFTSVTVSWSLPSVQQCLTNYQLVINNTNSNQQETINTTSTASNYMIVGRTRGIEYCYTVSAVDTANRTGPQSNRNCFTLDTPLQPIITSVRATNYPTDLSGDNVTVDVIAEWIQPVSSRPPVLNYTVVHNISTTDDNITTTVLAPSVNVTGAMLGSTYYIEVLASNTLGIGLPTQTVIVIPTSVISTTSVVSSSFSSNPVIPTSPSPSPSDTPEGTRGRILSIGAIIGIVIAIVAILVVILIAVVLVYILVKKKNRPKEKKAVAPQSEEVFYADLEVSSSSNNRKPKGKPAKQPVAHEPVQYSALQHSQQQHYADIDHSGSSGRRGVPEDRSAVEYREIQQH